MKWCTNQCMIKLNKSRNIGCLQVVALNREKTKVPAKTSNHVYTTSINNTPARRQYQRSVPYETPPAAAGLGDGSMPLSLLLLERRDLGVATPVFIISVSTNCEAHHTAVRQPRVFNAKSRTAGISETMSTMKRGKCASKPASNKLPRYTTGRI